MPPQPRVAAIAAAVAGPPMLALEAMSMACVERPEAWPSTKSVATCTASWTRRNGTTLIPSDTGSGQERALARAADFVQRALPFGVARDAHPSRAATLPLHVRLRLECPPPDARAQRGVSFHLELGLPPETRGLLEECSVVVRFPPALAVRN